ncbi:4473_t:CDS:2 [Ambispora leptoticha]|uniref:4473_t:CDS:1 n=1 Tax=Ambispora leptoticha TaxID=144679 RepID=A0A9N9F9R0_9GLOM|nr:4473_t:CDS:2 [Ambispora leptoticha]
MCAEQSNNDELPAHIDIKCKHRPDVGSNIQYVILLMQMVFIKEKYI